MLQKRLEKVQNVLISGASGGIAGGLVAEVRKRWPKAQCHLLSTSREELSCALEGDLTYRVDYEDTESLQRFARRIAEQAPSLDVVVHCAGFLHEGHQMPEKSLDECRTDQLLQSFQVNAVSFLLLTKSLKKILRRSDFCVFAALSAKVGSIGDNQMGGWYGYRASKAALNMCVKNVSIELGRFKKKLAVIAIHPGTTPSSLSEPFIKSWPKEKLYEPSLTATRIMNVIEGVDSSQNGSFLNWDGSSLPW